MLISKNFINFDDFSEKFLNINKKGGPDAYFCGLALKYLFSCIALPEQSFNLPCDSGDDCIIEDQR